MKNFIIKKEWQEFLQDNRVHWIVGILYILFAVALISGYKYYVETRQTQQNAQAATYAQWLQQGAKNPHGAAHYGFYAYKPLSALALIDKGMEGFLGQAVWLEAHNQNEVKVREANDAGSIVRFGQLSIGFLWQFLVPLAIILLSFNLFSKEREGGTLRLLLSSETSLWAILKGKAAALYRLVLLIFLPMMLLSLIAIWLAAGTDVFMEGLPALLLVFVFYAAYFGLWSLGGLWVSTKATNSGVALVTLLGFWVFGTFFIPRMSGSIAKTAFVAPSSFQFSNDVRLDGELGIDRKTPANLRKKQLEEGLLKQYKVDSLSQLPIDYRGISLQSGEEYGELIYEKNYGNLHSIYKNQDAVMNWFNLVSPALAMRNVSSGLAGTDLNRHLDFAQKAEKHRFLIAETMNIDIQKNAVGKPNYQGNANLWQKIPNFKYDTPSVFWALKQQILSILSLIVWLFVVFYLLKIQAKQTHFAV